MDTQSRIALAALGAVTTIGIGVALWSTTGRRERERELGTATGNQRSYDFVPDGSFDVTVSGTDAAGKPTYDVKPGTRAEAHYASATRSVTVGGRAIEGETIADAMRGAQRIARRGFDNLEHAETGNSAILRTHDGYVAVPADWGSNFFPRQLTTENKDAVALVDEQYASLGSSVFGLDFNSKLKVIPSEHATDAERAALEHWDGRSV